LLRLLELAGLLLLPLSQRLMQVWLTACRAGSLPDQTAGPDDALPDAALGVSARAGGSSSGCWRFTRDQRAGKTGFTDRRQGHGWISEDDQYLSAFWPFL
jgi:hypothetical protein